MRSGCSTAVRRPRPCALAGSPRNRQWAWVLLAILIAQTWIGPASAQQPSSDPATSAPRQAQSKKDLVQAKAEVLGLLRAGKFAEAVPHAEQALRLSEALHGPDSGESATAAHNLGFALKYAGRLPEAQGHLERALLHYASTLPAIHEDTRNALGELGQIYLQQGRGEEVVRLYELLIARAGREGYANHIGTAHSHNSLAYLLRALKRPAESQPHWEQAIAIYAQTSSPGDQEHRAAIDGLFDHYLASRQHDKARSLVSDTLQTLDKQGRPAGKWIARPLLYLSDMEHAAGRYGAARAQAARALEVLDPQGNGTGADIADALNSLARAERALANYAAAEGHYKRAIPILEAQPSKATAGIVHDNLGVLYSAMERFGEAEQHHKRALQLIEEALGRQHPSAGRAAANLGTLLFHTGRMSEAELLLKRGLESAEAQSPPDPATIATITDNLAGVFRVTGRLDLALQHLRRALATFEQTLPPDHPSLGTMRNNLGRYLLDVGDYAEAEAQLSQSLRLAEAQFGSDHPALAVTLANLGALHLATGRHAEARGVLARTVSLLEGRFGRGHSSLLIPLAHLGSTELADGRAKAALAAFERAVAIDLAQRTRGGPRARSDRGEERRAFAGLIEALWQVGDGTGVRDVTRALEIGQWETITPATVALAALGARLGSGDPALGGLVRERQDLAEEWSQRDKRLTELLSQGGERDAAFETTLRERLGAIEERLGAIDAELQATFPRYGDLARPAPLPIVEAQALLRPNEAALQFVVGPQATHIWLVTRTDARWVRLAVTQRDLTDQVQALRCGLDRAEWIGEGAERCRRLLDISADATPADDAPLPYDLARAHALYGSLFGPIVGAIKGKDLLVIASGPLTSLPFHALVSTKPGPANPGAAPDYAGAAWLARSHAITVLPSLASLKALRAFAQVSKASGPFIGFGNPLLTGADGTDRAAWAKQACAGPSSAPAVRVAGRKATSDVSRLVRGGLGDVEALRHQVPLPETADELCAVARFVGAGDQQVFLGEKASERTIKALSRSGALAGSRILHFATHGLLAGETEMFTALRAEPALMLTPPETASDEDDGLLTASEVASLRLDADWVVLSACNTATGAGAGAEAVSGLGRAFFYAGTRTLLVTNWAVHSLSARDLVTDIFRRHAADGRLARAEALRQAMVALMDGAGYTDAGKTLFTYGHPMFWAPYTIIGDGGG